MIGRADPPTGRDAELLALLAFTGALPLRETAHELADALLPFIPGPFKDGDFDPGVSAGVFAGGGGNS